MECGVPIFDIFFNSPCPETEASLWLQKSCNPSSNTSPISTSFFVSLLTKPTGAHFSVSSAPNQDKRVMWIQTMPDLVQARILSFLAYDCQRFCNKDLCRVASVMLDEGNDLDFWVKKAAEKLLDLVSVSDYRWISHLNLDSEEEHLEDEFQWVPDWLRDVAKENEPLFSWLPVSPDELNLKTTSSVCGGSEDEPSIGVEEEKKEEDLDEVVKEFDAEGMTFDEPLDQERLVNVDSNAKATELAEEIHERRKCRKLFGRSKFD